MWILGVILIGGILLSSRAVARDTPPYLTQLKAVGNRYDLDWRLLAAIMWVESMWGRHPAVALGLKEPTNPASVSDDGLSYGLMQITPATANRTRVALGKTYGIRELNNPAISIELAGRILAELRQYYFPNDVDGMIRAYNGGPGWRASGPAAQAMTADYLRKVSNKWAELRNEFPETRERV